MSFKQENTEQELIEILKTSSEMMEVIDACFEYRLPNYYVAGGSITQAIWNWKLGLPILENVKDFDVIYYEHEETEEQAANREMFLKDKIKHTIPVDVNNQAFVHKWYPEKFGKKINPYTKTEDGILSWLPAFAIGIRKVAANEYQVYAPYGLEDTFDMIIRPNKKVMPQESYIRMTQSYSKRWPQVTVVDW